MRVDNLKWFEMAAYDWNQVHLTFNEHHSDYLTAEQELKAPFIQGRYKDVEKDTIEDMAKHDCIWHLQIYPRTPVVFVQFFGSTLDDVLEEARKYFRLELMREASNDRQG